MDYSMAMHIESPHTDNPIPKQRKKSSNQIYGGDASGSSSNLLSTGSFPALKSVKSKGKSQFYSPAPATALSPNAYNATDTKKVNTFTINESELVTIGAFLNIFEREPASNRKITLPSLSLKPSFEPSRFAGLVHVPMLVLVPKHLSIPIIEPDPFSKDSKDNLQPSISLSSAFFNQLSSANNKKSGSSVQTAAICRI